MANTAGINGSARPFRDALRLEVAAAGADQKALRHVARALLQRAGNGDVSAITMLADRLDGKVPQPVGGAEELGPQRLQISWKQPGLQPATANAAAEVVGPAALSVTSHQL